MKRIESARIGVLCLCLWVVACPSVVAGFIPEWEATWDSGENDQVFFLAVDSDGNSYLGGGTTTNYFNSIAPFSLVKFTAEGEYAWSKVVPGAVKFGMTALEVDANGNALVGVQMWTPDAANRGTVFKFNEAGSELWRKAFPPDIVFLATEVENIFVSSFGAGVGVQKLDPGGGTLWSQGRVGGSVTIGPNGEVMVWGHRGFAMLGPSGSILWNVTNFPTAALQVGRSGHIYAGGSTNQPFMVNDAFVLGKFTPQGDLVWRRLYEGPRMRHHADPFDELTALAVDENENVYVTGSMKSESSGSVVPVLKYSSDGEFLWRSAARPTNAAQNAYSGQVRPRELLLDREGNVYVPLNTTTPAEPDLLVVKYDPNGTAVARISGTTPTPWRIQMGLNSEDKLLVATSMGDYRTNGDFVLTKYAQVLDTNQPTILKPLRDQIVGEGGSFALEIELEGGGNLAYQWRKNGVPIQGETNASFNIPSASYKDEGDYSVHIAYESGMIQSTEANLKVILLPRFQDPTELKTTILGGDLSLNGTVYSTEPAEFSWLQDETLIPEADKGELLLTDLDPRSGGKYTTFASNNAGTVRHEAYVSVFSGAEVLWESPLDGRATGLEVDSDGSLVAMVAAETEGRWELAKFSRTGVKQWSRELERRSLMALDSGSAILVASVAGILDDSGNLSYELHLDRYSDEGEIIWSRTDTLWHLSDLVVSGSHVHILGWGGGASDRLLVYDLEGNERWRNFWPAGEAARMGVDGSGAVFVYYRAATGNLILRKFSSTGVELWSRTYEQGRPSAIVVSPEGDVYLAAESSPGAIIFRVSPDGKALWKRSEVRPSNNVNLWLNGRELIAVGSYALRGYFSQERFFVEKLTSTGSLVWRGASHGNPYYYNGNTRNLALVQPGTCFVAGPEVTAWSVDGLLLFRMDDLKAERVAADAERVYVGGNKIVALQMLDQSALPAFHIAESKAIEGEPVLLEIQPPHPSVFTYQWTFEGDVIWGATNARYAIPEVETGHAGLYGVIISDNSGARAWPNAHLQIAEKTALAAAGLDIEKGEFILTFFGESGVRYEILRSSDLQSWQPEVEVTAKEGQTAVILKFNPAKMQFFRLVKLM